MIGLLLSTSHAFADKYAGEATVGLTSNRNEVSVVFSGAAARRIFENLPVQADDMQRKGQNISCWVRDSSPTGTTCAFVLSQSGSMTPSDVPSQLPIFGTVQVSDYSPSNVSSPLYAVALKGEAADALFQFMKTGKLAPAGRTVSYGFFGSGLLGCQIIRLGEYVCWYDLDHEGKAYCNYGVCGPGM
jgi:hypothetical protein